MNAAHPAVSRELPARLAAFAALAALAAFQWARLVADPPAGRVIVCVAALTAGAALLALLATRDLGRLPTVAIAALGVACATAAGLVAIGVPARLLEPGNWDRLADEVGRGFAGLDGDVTYPYGGKNEWARLVLLAGLPLALGLAAALSFWPSGRLARGARVLGLAVLIATYAVAATSVAPDEPLLWGLLLFVAVAAWLWLPRLRRGDVIWAAALAAAAAAIAVAGAARLDAEKPWIDYVHWELGGSSDTSGVTYDWNHGYGPIDWPRDGTVLFSVASDEPHYWRASILEHFDGTRWIRPDYAAGELLEVPDEVDGTSDVIKPANLNPDWIEVVDVTFGPMGSELLIAPGAVIDVSGLQDLLSRPDGTTILTDDPIEEGDAYTVVSYVPDPTPQQMRTAPPAYPRVLERFTQVGLPQEIAGKNGTPSPTPVDVDVPLRGGDPIGDHAAQRLLASPYGEIYRLSHRLTDDAPTNYDAVRSVASYLRRGTFAYDESPPKREYPLAAFVSRDRAGYCQQFSGAMALMLRMVGIPSRVATGFTAGEPDPDAGDAFQVTDYDAHSWVEVYFSEIGWVPFDPTPIGTPAASRLHQANSTIAVGAPGSERRLGGPTITPGKGKGGGSRSSGGTGIWKPLLVPAGLLLLGALLLGALAAIRARRFRALAPSAAADALLGELRSALGRLGTAIQPGETLLALERRLRRRVRPAAARYVARLRTGRFEAAAPDPPSLADRRALRRELASKRGLRGRLRALVAVPPGGPRAG